MKKKQDDASKILYHLSHFNCGEAASFEDLCQAFHLIFKEYRALGYTSSHEEISKLRFSLYQLFPVSHAFVAKAGNISLELMRQGFWWIVHHRIDDYFIIVKLLLNSPHLILEANPKQRAILKHSFPDLFMLMDFDSKKKSALFLQSEQDEAHGYLAPTPKWLREHPAESRMLQVNLA